MANSTRNGRRIRTTLHGASLVGVLVATMAGGASAQSDATPDAAWFAAQLQQHLEREHREPMALASSTWAAQLQDHFEREHADDTA